MNHQKSKSSKAKSFYNGYNISVKGLSDGFINISPSGGSAGYIYEWSTVDGSRFVNADRLALIASINLGIPIKLIYTREAMMKDTEPRTASYHKLTAGISKNQNYLISE